MKYALIQVGTLECQKTLAISGSESFVSPDANWWFFINIPTHLPSCQISLNRQIPH